MAQLNLLPDVKLEYAKAQRSRRLVLTVSVLVTGLAVALLVVLLVINVAQKKHLTDLSNDINKEVSTLQGKPQIAKILTVQNQLQSLTALHNGKPAASRLFTTYLNQVTPATVHITDFHIDFPTQVIILTGTADSLSSINKYVDTLKFTTYTSAVSSKSATSANANAFNNVVLSGFGLNQNATDPTQVATYTITLAYDKPIFDTTQTVTLSVPNLITTRSELDQPGDLFKSAPAPASGTVNGGGQ